MKHRLNTVLKAATSQRRAKKKGGELSQRRAKKKGGELRWRRAKKEESWRLERPLWQVLQQRRRVETRQGIKSAAN